MDILTPALVADSVVGLLCALLLVAVWTDVKGHRIPNRLVFAGAALGILLNTFLPEGRGFVSILPGALGFWSALAGMVLGVAIPLPMYALRAMGAGDVKLMAMVGAFLGPLALGIATLLIFIIGGVLSMLTALRYGTLGLLISNVRTIMLSSFFKAVLHEMPVVDSAPVSAGKMPYGVAIAAGTYLYIVLANNGYLDFIRAMFVK
ncbi:MAG: A24 family peptidase [Pseudomonadota bacterium]